MQYFRQSKFGNTHSYTRTRTIVCLRCDDCDSYFERQLKHMNKKRLNNNFFHCCSRCDSKKFAQKKSIERKKIWDMPASVDLPVRKY